MSDTILSDLPKVVCEAIKARLPELAACRPYAGKFTLEELKQKGLASPAVLVSCLGAKQDTTYGGAATSYMLSMAAYVVVKDSMGSPRDVRAANICQVLLALVPHKNWGMDALGAAQNTKLHTLISGKTRDQAVTLWAVTWDQPIGFHEPFNGPLGADLYVAKTPGGGAGDANQFEQIGGAS